MINNDFFVYEKLSQNLAANASWTTYMAGNFLRISASVANVDITLYRNGRQVGVMKNMAAGDYIRDFEFDGFEIDNQATAQTIDLQITNGVAGSDRILGEVTVKGTVKTQDAGTAFGATYKAINNLAVGGVDTVFTPLANTNGALISGLSFQSGTVTVGGVQQGGFYARSAAPTVANDSGNILSGVELIQSGGNYFTNAQLQAAIFLPAGLGLYFFSAQLESSANRNAVYTLL